MEQETVLMNMNDEEEKQRERAAASFSRSSSNPVRLIAARRLISGGLDQPKLANNEPIMLVVKPRSPDSSANSSSRLTPVDATNVMVARIDQFRPAASLSQRSPPKRASPNSINDHLIKLIMFLAVLLSSHCPKVDCQNYYFHSSDQFLAASKHLILNHQPALNQLFRPAGGYLRQASPASSSQEFSAERRASAAAGGQTKGPPQPSDSSGRLLVCYYTTRQAAPLWPSSPGYEYAFTRQVGPSASGVQSQTNDVHQPASSNMVVQPSLHYFEPLASQRKAVTEFGFGPGEPQIKNQQQQLVFKSAAVMQPAQFAGGSQVTGSGKLLTNEHVSKGKHSPDSISQVLVTDQNQQPQQQQQQHINFSAQKSLANKHKQQPAAYNLVGDLDAVNNGLIVSAKVASRQTGAAALAATPLMPYNGNNGKGFIITSKNNNGPIQHEPPAQRGKSLQVSSSEQLAQLQYPFSGAVSSAPPVPLSSASSISLAQTVAPAFSSPIQHQQHQQQQSGMVASSSNQQALVSSPLSTMFDVFGAASQYLMRFKPSSLISPASLSFNTIQVNEQHGSSTNGFKSVNSTLVNSIASGSPGSSMIPLPFSAGLITTGMHKSSPLTTDRSNGGGILSRLSSQNNQNREDVCGRTIQTPQRRIIGGEGARYGEFPYQVHIKIAKHQCGGALIDRQSIVTAAHCVYHFISRAPVSKLQIVIGAYDIEDEQYQELPPQYFKVDKVKLHPNFRFSASHPDRYDIAILKLDKPVKYTDNVLPVCLPSKDLKFESMVGTVTGFGKTDPSLSNRYGTRLLQKVDVPIIENNECERWHRTRGIDLKIFPEMMCAGYEDGLKDACVGDSGGPLVVKTSTGPNGSFRWTLAGITSAGFGCAQSRQPGIYHRVSHTVDWILDNLD